MKSSNLSLVENFGNMDPLVGQNQIDRLLRGLVKQPTEKVDFNFVEDVSFLFQIILGKLIMKLPCGNPMTSKMVY
jgi:hypothetical protein